MPLLVAELDNLPVTPKEPYWLASAGRVAQLLCRTDDDRAWSALTRNAKRVDIGQRLEIIQTIGSRIKKADDRAIAFLSAFLDDEETRELMRLSDLANVDDIAESLDKDLFSGPSAGFTFDRLSVRDFAALQLAETLGVKANADASWKESDWKSLRSKVRHTLNRNAPR